MRVGIIGLLHESNTFIAEKTTLEHFRQDVLLTGEAVTDRFTDTRHELGGFLAGLSDESLEAVPLFAARAVPYGPITTDAFQQLLEVMHTELQSAGPLDGILVAPHGATVCETIPDADGHWLSELRTAVGDSISIIGTLDPHANLSQRMVDNTTALIAYRTNPHLDQFARGVEAARLMAKTLHGEVQPVQYAEFPPLAINIERQMTSEPHLVPLYDAANESLAHSTVLSNSILLGFPYADVAEMGSSVLVVTDGDAEFAQNEAHRLAEQMWDSREQLDGVFVSMADAVQQASNLPGPVCLLDMGDNVGGGSPGDSTHLAHTISTADAGRSLICLCDPESVEQSVQAGIAATLKLEVGGKTDDLHGSPVVGTFIVRSVHDGKFSDPQTRHGGFTKYDQGQSAVVEQTDGPLTILLTSRRIPPFSLVQLTSCNLEPTDFQIIVAKGVNAPVAAYAPVCPHLIRVNSPGCTTADMKQLSFERRRQPMFPFESSVKFND